LKTILVLVVIALWGHNALASTGLLDIRFTPPAFATKEGKVNLDLQVVSLNGNISTP